MKQKQDDTATLDRPKTSSQPDRQKGQSQGNSAGALDKQEMMKKAEEAGKPGLGHKALEHFVGNWKGEVKCWMEPGGEPNVSSATATARWILNGRFLQEDFTGDMMGKPFHGQTLLGFDNTKQTFNSVWVSDMQTSMFTSEGKGDNKVITLEGTTSCPATGRSDIPMRVVLKVLSPDKHTFEMFDQSKGQNAKTMEITYTRK